MLGCKSSWPNSTRCHGDGAAIMTAVNGLELIMS
jgi:hypothetical protein